jgi:hypothetical protein
MRAAVKKFFDAFRWKMSYKRSDDELTAIGPSSPIAEPTNKSTGSSSSNAGSYSLPVETTQVPEKEESLIIEQVGFYTS